MKNIIYKIYHDHNMYYRLSDAIMFSDIKLAEKAAKEMFKQRWELIKEEYNIKGKISKESAEYWESAHDNFTVFIDIYKENNGKYDFIKKVDLYTGRYGHTHKLREIVASVNKQLKDKLDLEIGDKGVNNE